MEYRKCDTCGAKADYACECLGVAYCCPNHQMIDWPKHKISCTCIEAVGIVRMETMDAYDRLMRVIKPIFERADFDGAIQTFSESMLKYVDKKMIDAWIPKNFGDLSISKPRIIFQKFKQGDVDLNRLSSGDTFRRLATDLLIIHALVTIIERKCSKVSDGISMLLFDAATRNPLRSISDIVRDKGLTKDIDFLRMARLVIESDRMVYRDSEYELFDERAIEFMDEIFYFVNHRPKTKFDFDKSLFDKFVETVKTLCMTNASFLEDLSNKIPGFPKMFDDFFMNKLVAYRSFSFDEMLLLYKDVSHVIAIMSMIKGGISIDMIASYVEARSRAVDIDQGKFMLTWTELATVINRHDPKFSKAIYNFVMSVKKTKYD